jgi:diacylglycerol kinase (ATP)
VEHEHFRSGLPRERPLCKSPIFRSGIKYAVANDFSAGSVRSLSYLTIAACFFFRRWLEVLAILVVTGLMLAPEPVNTGIEDLCDFVEPRHNERIGVIKDVSSTAVGIGVLVWVVTRAGGVGRARPGNSGAPTLEFGSGRLKIEPAIFSRGPTNGKQGVGILRSSSGAEKTGDHEREDDDGAGADHRAWTNGTECRTRTLCRSESANGPHRT